MEHQATNLLGGILFWLYILAALLLTGLAIRSIYIDAIDAPPPTSSVQRRTQLFVILALISFSCLSYNMINVLILSYRRWAFARNIAVPDSLSGPGGLFGSGSRPLYLWEWSTTSTLFKDFAEALLEGPKAGGGSRQGWTTAVLALTFNHIRYMAIVSFETGMEDGWIFVALGQIVPVSFAQILFYIKLLYSTRQRRSRHLPIVMLAAAFYIPSILGPRISMAMQNVAIFRAGLALPALCRWLEKDQEPSADELSIMWWQLAFVNITLVVIGFEGLVEALFREGPAAIYAALSSHPAVSALSYDLFISLVAWALWRNVSQSMPRLKAQIPTHDHEVEKPPLKV